MIGLKTVFKVLLATAVLIGVGVLFVRSVQQSHSQPYTVNREHLREWRVEIDETSGPAGALVVLRAPPELGMGLFRQVFTRAMESLNTPATPAVPLLLRSEYERAFAGHLSPEALLARARDAGLETAMVQPRCLAHRRLSEPRSVRQLYFVLFEAPGFHRFRGELRAMLNGTARATDFDPAAVSPVLFIAASGTGFEQWLPLRADESECIAPIDIG
jgi:hypothetical protein